LTCREFEKEKSEVAFRLTEADLLKTAVEVILMRNPSCMPQTKSSNQLLAGSEETLVGSSESTNYCISEPLTGDDNEGVIAATPESFSLERINETQPHTSNDTIAQIAGVGGGPDYQTESRDSLNVTTKHPKRGLSNNSILDELFYGTHLTVYTLKCSNFITMNIPGNIHCIVFIDECIIFEAIALKQNTVYKL